MSDAMRIRMLPACGRTCRRSKGALGTYFQERLAAAAEGQNFSDPIVINRSGPANGGNPMYNWDKNNFQPRIALAWSPNYSQGLLHSLFGDSGKSVVRGGFAITNGLLRPGSRGGLGFE